MNLPSPENPLTITLEIKSPRDLLNLWHRLNAAESEINLLSRASGHKYKWSRTDNSSWSWWHTVNDAVKALNLEDQL